MKNNFRLAAAVSCALALTAAVVACSAPPEPAQANENVGEQHEAICLHWPCTAPVSGSSGLVATSSGVSYDPGGYSFTCKGPVPGTTNEFYEITPKGCAIVEGCKPDSGTANIVSTQSDGGCWGYTVVGYYLCPVNHPTLSCNQLTGTCSCY